MANSVILATRIAIVAFLKSAPLVTAIIDDRTVLAPDPQQTWPYARYGTATAVPLLGQCLAGKSINITIHAFAKGETDDAATDLAGAIEHSLAGLTLALDTPFPAKLSDIRWTQTQVLRDTGQADGWHGVVQFVATVVS